MCRVSRVTKRKPTQKVLLTIHPIVPATRSKPPCPGKIRTMSGRPTGRFWWTLAVQYPPISHWTCLVSVHTSWERMTGKQASSQPKCHRSERRRAKLTERRWWPYGRKDIAFSKLLNALESQNPLAAILWNAIKSKGSMIAQPPTLPPPRPEKMNRRERRHLIYQAKRSRRAALGILTRIITIQVSMNTARKVLKQAGLQKCQANWKPYLSPLHKLKRLLWCRERWDCTMQAWETWIWTDELRFEVGYVGGVVWVFRTKQEADLAAYLLPTFKSGRTSVMIWGQSHWAQRVH